ncbi:MAG: ABC transporter substrate-binding protein [Leptospiraceae bacterium]|nr:ABC transporter substrate-binding protein [Leptospiraceae bacterium]MDW7975258.1 ABC transporter substrate-binding protein [Leptospiraceae bacterium]
MKPIILLLFLFLISCREPWNNPYSDFDKNKKVLLSALADEPRTLDPIKATDVISITILSNITATPYQYDYKARPLKMIPLLAKDYPETGYKSHKNQLVYYFRFELKEAYYYPEECLGKKKRPILAEDFILMLKRTANRKINPFAFPLLDNIIGFMEYSQYLETFPQKETMEMYEREIEGVRKYNQNGIEILLKKPDPRIPYFFAMTASSPLPKECLEYSLRNPEYLLDHHPISSGAFYLHEWKRNQRMILRKNPNYYETSEYFQESLPRIEEVYFHIIRSGPTIWTLFRQGYIDRIGLNQDTMQQVLDGTVLSEKYRKMGILLTQAKEPVTYGWVFNLRDPIFKNNPHLRRAIACAIDVEELIFRFFRNRAIPANGLIPPEMEGHLEDDPLIKKYPIRNCQHLVPELLTKAGYPPGHPQGRDKNQKPLELRLTAVAGGAGTAVYRFYTESLAKYGIELKVDLYDAPTFFEKRHKGEFQIAGWGWGADYPDPQNFFQLFYSKNIETGYNEAGYINPEFDRLYEQLLETTQPEIRKNLVYRMNEILLRDLPVAFTFHPVTFSIQWPWLEPIIPHPLDLNQLKYRSVNPEFRFQKWLEINSLF